MRGSRDLALQKLRGTQEPSRVMTVKELAEIIDEAYMEASTAMRQRCANLVRLALAETDKPMADALARSILDLPLP